MIKKYFFYFFLFFDFYFFLNFKEKTKKQKQKNKKTLDAIQRYYNNKGPNQIHEYTLCPHTAVGIVAAEKLYLKNSFAFFIISFKSLLYFPFFFFFFPLNF